jgi:drug/metabolite transporter (DMT)-like permease
MTLEHLALALILLAAFLHAATNLLIKISGDPLLLRGMMSAVAALVVLPAVFLVPVPNDAAWAYLLVSVLVHAAYPFLLAATYRRGDLSVVFPVARGISPLGVLALVVLFDAGGAGLPQFLGVLTVTTGILLLVLHGRSRSALSHRPAMLFAAATGLVVAAYTYLDAHGVRAAETPLSYIVWLVVIDGALCTAAIAAVRGKQLHTYAKEHWRIGAIASLLGLLNFGMALYALALGSLVEIAALRETSVLFAAFLGATYLKEGFARVRLTAAALVAGGIVTMQLFR